MKRENIPAILLVGGKGTRLQTVVSSKPKPLAPVGNIPFLELLVMQLRSQGVHRMIMSTGHLADQIEETFGDGGRGTRHPVFEGIATSGNSGSREVCGRLS